MSDASDEHLRAAWRLAGRPRVRSHIQMALSPRVVEHRGSRIHLDPRDNYTEFRIWLDGACPEERELDWIEANLRGLDLNAFDIGANAGVYSLFLATVLGPKSRILAFEPNPEMCERLRKNVLLNGYDSIDVQEVALSGRPGVVYLTLPERTDRAQNLGEASVSAAPQAGRGSIEVRAETLLNYARDTPPEFLKIDVEGHEAEILLPYLEAVDRSELPRFILMERAHQARWFGDLWSRLTALGFAVALETPRNAILERRGTA